MGPIHRPFSGNLSVFDSFPSRDGHFDEPRDLLHATRGIGPDEPEKVAPSLQVFPRVASVSSEELLQRRMRVVDLVHRLHDGAILSTVRLQGLSIDSKKASPRIRPHFRCSIQAITISETSKFFIFLINRVQLWHETR